jgi:predicted Rossmann-fold nucleotide-binding protein
MAGGQGLWMLQPKGRTAGKGQTIAVTFSPKEAGSFEGRYLKNLANVYKEVVTNNYIARMFALIEYSDMFLIFKGGSGTLSEFGAVWVLANIYHGHHKPFILYGGYWWEIIDTLYKT